MKYFTILILLIHINLYGNESLSICQKVKKAYSIEDKLVENVLMDSNIKKVLDLIKDNDQKNTYPKDYQLNPQWISDIEWLTWKPISNFNNKVRDGGYQTEVLLIANKRIGNNNLILTVGGLGWRGYVYRMFLIPDNKINKFIEEAKLANDNSAFDFNFKSFNLIFPTKEFSPNDFAWNFRNVFIYKNEFYILLGDWKTDEFNISKISKDSIQILCSFNDRINNRGDFYFLQLFGEMLNKVSGCGYDETCKGSIGNMNCWHDGKKYVTELITKKIKPHLIKEDEYQEYNSFLKGNFFRLYSYSDIWTNRFYNTLITVLPLAENELKNMLISTYKYNEKKANKLAKHYIAKSLEITLNGHHGAGLSVLYEEEKENKSKKLNHWLQMQQKAINKGYLNPNIEYEFAYNIYSFQNTDTQSLLIDHIEFMSKNKLKNILKFKNTNEFGKNLLMYSSHMNHFNSVKNILSFENINSLTKKDVEYSCSNVKVRGRSALTYACENASKELIALLVQNKADRSISDSQKNTLEYYLKKNPYLDEFDKKQGLEFLNSLKTLNIKKLKPSFNCKKARTRREQAICSSNTLSNYDRSMSILYTKLKDRKNFDKIQLTQRQWNKDIKFRCNSYTLENDYKACLAREIRNRTYFLQKVYELEEIKK